MRSVSCIQEDIAQKYKGRADAHFRKIISPDCRAVIDASMAKRIHECQKAMDEFFNNNC